jgi:hypothetical protein
VLAEGKSKSFASLRMTNFLGEPVLIAGFEPVWVALLGRYFERCFFEVRVARACSLPLA